MADSIQIGITTPDSIRYSIQTQMADSQVPNTECATCYRPSVCLSHGLISQKRLKLGSCNFHHRVAQTLYFLRYKFNPKTLIYKLHIISNKTLTEDDVVMS